MAKTIDVLNGAATSIGGKQIETGISLGAIAKRAAAFFQRQDDADIERFIQERGGVFNDEMERQISRYISKGTRWE
jgi:hypothetical protein